MRTKIALAALAMLLVAGCAETSRTRTASQESLVTATATVEAVDQTTRQVTLRDNADGSSFTVTAGPEVRNLDQIAAGDQVQIDYYQALTVDMAGRPTPASPPPRW